MRQRVQLLTILALVGALSWFAREERHRRVELPGRAGWITTDPDSLYQMRRVERALLEGLPVAERDELISHPDGSAIPWPPYYTLTLTSVLAPFAPDDPDELHAWLEMRVGSAAIVFSVLGSLLAALAARRIAGDGAALIAGVLHAFCGASVAYGASGNGDHHALVSLVAGALLYVATFAFSEAALASRARSLLHGVVLGVLAGYALGVWVASLMYVLQLQLALGWLVVQHSRQPRRGVAPLGLGFHLAALAVVLPAVATSPWRAENPWFVVNLSWFHPALLALGACVFAPLLALRGGSRGLRAWPWLVAGALALLGATLASGDSGPARGLREGFAWVSRTDQFMAHVGESRPLIGPGTGADLFDALGYGAVLAPLAWAALAWGALNRRELTLVPWAVAFPLLAIQTLRQARFAEALALPLAVVLGWGVAQVAGKWTTERRPGSLAPPPMFGGTNGASQGFTFPRPLGRAAALAVLLLALALAAQLPCVLQVVERWREGRNANSRERPAAVATRMACEWLRRNVPREPPPAVLANWPAGHALEWAGCASIATNFGAYVGEDSFRAPARFLMSEDPDAGDALLAERGARFVLVDSELPNQLNSLIPLGAPQLRERYVTSGSERGGGVEPEWCLTLGARLLFDGGVCGPLGEGARPLDRLRLVWVSPVRDPERTLRSTSDFAPAAMLWERVAGALVEARAAPGDELTLQIRVRYPRAGRELVWRDRVRADASGVARTRVPYATDAPNGEGRAEASARWTLGRDSGVVAISEDAVLTGAVVELR